MKLIVYGDSHSMIGWHCRHIVHYYGPLLCYTLGKEKWRVMDISLYEDVEDGDTCVFCFGEIDCRCHIKKHVTDENTYQNIIDDIIHNYLETVRENIEKCGKSVNVYIFNVVPPSREHEVGLKHPEFPFRGTDEERKEYVLYFNEKLKEHCKVFGFKFFDVYDYYKDEEGYLIRSLSDGNVHVKDGIHILKFIDENIELDIK